MKNSIQYMFKVFTHLHHDTILAFSEDHIIKEHWEHLSAVTFTKTLSTLSWWDPALPLSSLLPVLKPQSAHTFSCSEDKEGKCV